MRFIALSIITFYQRFLSSRKGFVCAHHQLHGGQTCSNAVKTIITKVGLLSALPKIKTRFKECGAASHILQNTPKADLPCDVGCIDIGFDGCGGDSNAGGKSSRCSLLTPFEILLEVLGQFWGGSNKRVRIISLILFACLVFALSYWFYGRGMNTVYIMDKSTISTDLTIKDKLFNKFTQRGNPDLRVLVRTNDDKVYSYTLEGVELSQSSEPLKFTLGKAIFNLPDSLSVMDARVKVAGLAVASQVLEKIENPAMQGQGERFSYEFKRRWF